MQTSRGALVVLLTIAGIHKIVVVFLLEVNSWFDFKY